jgi:hypothetical protein
MRHDLLNLVFESLRSTVRSADRRSVAAGSVLALVVWALAIYGARSQTSAAMALIVVVSGGTAALLFELEGHCDRLRLPPRKVLPVARRWVCLQGAGLLSTLLCLGAIG